MPPQRIECIMLRHTPESLGRLWQQNVGGIGIDSLFVLLRANGTLIDGLYGRGQCPNPIDFRLRHWTTVLLPPSPHSAPFPDRHSLEVFLLTISTPFSFLTAPLAMPPRHNLSDGAMAGHRWPFLSISRRSQQSTTTHQSYIKYWITQYHKP